MAELESKLEGFFRHRVKALGGYTVKLAPMEAGVPDRLVIFPGNRMYLVELKADAGQLSSVQRVWHQRMYERFDVPVFTLRGRSEVLTFLRAVVDAVAAEKSKPGPRPKLALVR